MPAGCGPHGGAWWPKAENLSVSLPSQTAAATVKKLRESGVHRQRARHRRGAGESDFFNVEGTIALPHANLYKMHHNLFWVVT